MASITQLIDFRGLGIPFDTETVTVSYSGGPAVVQWFTVPGGARSAAIRVTKAGGGAAWGADLVTVTAQAQDNAASIFQFSEDGEVVVFDVSPSVQRYGMRQVTLAAGQSVTATALYFY